jgi:hypothetical protein
MENNKPKNRDVSVRKEDKGSILKFVRPGSWNRRQLVKMVKLGGVFVSQASA